MTASEEAEESKGDDAVKYGTRLLVLGASNVRRSLYPILEIARRSFPGPLDFLIVAGHGRSYGAPNRVFGWSLPGISKSEWTQHWHRADTRARFAIITDVGNDLLFGNDPSLLCHWVQSCLDEVSIADRIVVTGLPIERARGVGALQFSIFRKIFFPSSRVTFEEIIEGAKYVDEHLRKLVQQRACAWFEPSSKWYGIDPIHVRRTYLRAYWKDIMNVLHEPIYEGSQQGLHEPRSVLHEGSIPRLSLKWRERFYLVFSRAKHQSWCGASQDCHQPYLDLHDGSSVSFY